MRFHFLSSRITFFNFPCSDIGFHVSVFKLLFSHFGFYISGFNLYNEGLQVGFRAVQVPATGGCGYLTLIVLYMLSMREVLSVAPDGNGHAVSLPDDWEASCSDTLFCFSRLQCLTVLRVIADTNVVSHLNPSSMSDHSLKDQLGYLSINLSSGMASMMWRSGRPSTANGCLILLIFLCFSPVASLCGCACGGCALRSRLI